jgi:hypothetical protein
MILPKPRRTLIAGQGRISPAFILLQDYLPRQLNAMSRDHLGQAHGIRLPCPSGHLASTVIHGWWQFLDATMRRELISGPTATPERTLTAKFQPWVDVR